MFKNNLENKLFKSIFFIMLLDELTTAGASFLDGLTINIFLGNVAIAAHGIICPYFSLAGLISGVLSLGTEHGCIRAISQGDIYKAEKFFNTSFWTALILSTAVSVLLFVFSDSVVLFFGADKNPADLLIPASSYLKGVALGTPAIVLIPVLSPIVNTEGKNTNLKISMILNLVIDGIFDFISGVAGWGMFGMGLSTTISAWIAFIIIYVPFLKRALLKTKIGLFSIRELLSILHDGSPKMIKRLGKFIRPVIVNSFIISVGGTMAMSAMSVGNNILNLLGTLSSGLASTVLLLTIVYAGEHNGNELKRLINRALKYIFFLIVPVNILVFIFAPFLASIYAKDSVELLAMITDFIRFIAIDVVALSLADITTFYWQGIKRIKQVNTITMLQKLFYPVALLFLFGHFFGVKGFWLSFPAADLLTFLTFKIYAGKFFPNSKDCSYEKNIQKEFLIKNIDQISSILPEIISFCEKNGLNRKSAIFLSISFEETTINIIQHGFNRDKKSNSIYVFLTNYKGTIVMRIQDNCKKFNLIEKYKHFQIINQNPQRFIGIKMVMKLSKSIQYVNTFETNNVIITM